MELLHLAPFQSNPQARIPSQQGSPFSFNLGPTEHKQGPHVPGATNCSRSLLNKGPSTGNPLRSTGCAPCYLLHTNPVRHGPALLPAPGCCGEGEPREHNWKRGGDPEEAQWQCASLTYPSEVIVSNYPLLLIAVTGHFDI